MSNDLWRWADPDGQQRKVRFDELRAALAGGLIAPNTPVWRSGWQAWQPANEVPELTSASVGGANGVVLNIPPPPLAMLAVQHEYEDKSASLAPAAPAEPSAKEEEPPPPPAFIPMAAKQSIPPAHPSSSQQLRTQMGGSAHVPGAPSSSPVPAAPPVATRLGPSLPTAIGIPPPPEMVALANAKASASASASANVNPQRPTADAMLLPRTPVPTRAKSPPAGGEMIEELSGSMLLDAPSAQDVGSRSSNGAVVRGGGGGGRGNTDGLPPPTDPVINETTTADAGDEDAPAGLPRRPALNLSLILDGIAEIRKGRKPKNVLVLAVIGTVALSLIIMLIAGIASLFSGPSSSDKNKTAGSSSAPTASTLPTVTSAAATTAVPAATTQNIPPPPPPEEPKGVLGDCTTTGESKSIAPRAVIQSGIEAHALGGGLAIGFAPSARDAVATSLDPSSLAPTNTVRTRPTGGDARRVTPMLVGGKLAAVPDVDRKGDRLGGRRVVGASTLIDIGTADASIVWAPHGKDSFAKLFGLEGDGAVEALRAVALTDRKGIGLTFRRGNSILIGAAKGDSVLEADGELSKVAGLGQVGSPSIAASGDKLVAAWADRAGAQDEWKVRWTKMKIGATTDDATTFALPEGGLGGQAMSPSVASLGGGRFLLAWTEGPASNHQVRAITIGADGSPSGAALAISSAGVNAGQPAIVIGSDGRGAVAFIAAKGKALELHATPISCPAR